MYTTQLSIRDEDRFIKELNQGSNKAFQVFYERYQSRIFFLAMRYLKCRNEAQGVVQDVFMQLWINREEMEIGKPVEAWLYTVGKNNILNKLKKQANFWKVKEQLKMSQVFSDNSMQEKFIYSEYELKVNTTLKSLSDQQLVVYNMARHENLSYVEISKKLNLSPLTVKTHMSRALCHIRSVISPILID
ncbi:RNA polymerase sigma-70 factor [Flavobacterium circumlabens]|uniref:RNA polymerase sigma-70 factor n=1 Tax=Flavobacterium circumlabens TaxID=2133765 RepID=A0A4Y7UER7_9FLAO|nr:RNA polymerase sigma-70 factor [Flavobacterium circumlabens]TCN59569.1 RNA polymerase sigma-70 factor (ECF subfamily) [Flavobacterium circumlabens]TEB44854.1 RNA polymerase sigma-70 factor [Flavobacterium circumlabens]